MIRMHMDVTVMRVSRETDFLSYNSFLGSALLVLVCRLASY